MNAPDYLYQETGTAPREWEETKGPDSSVGVDCYIRHPALGMWYVSDDQGAFVAEP
jgi:hypothetical protein